MIKMVINNRLLIRRSAFVYLSTTKFLYKGINVMKMSNNNNIVSSFICRNQDVLPMKFLFQMPKREFRFSGERIKVIRVKRNTFINDLKKV